MSSKLVIVDYGMGNLNSVKKSLDRIRVSTTISSDPQAIINAEKIILPGVGHFGKAMSNLKELNLVEALHEAVLIKQKPILGICLGMELMAKKGQEGNAEGLGWVDAEIIKFNISDKSKYKIPHIGWNQIHVRTQHSPLMKSIPDLSEFYFLHSYHLKIHNQSEILNETHHEYFYPSAIEKHNIFGVQYHPEKSHEVGAQLLKNFAQM